MYKIITSKTKTTIEQQDTLFVLISGLDHKEIKRIAKNMGFLCNTSSAILKSNICNLISKGLILIEKIG
jgi:hypothetical protein